ncbi:YdeI/OmpD-associated family protein [Niabella sp. CC-SYL272]|uniref:YdeI/OmpD-associated family protein n=1 Tax=Niabella agricola TaxID=2891571 RepID=UPI001F297FDC|nr:YdeI/OmpD-associated family protein [Niabella agricola]MCF3108887.1 YdeI/OmpD-associated family protein [Niabella agricola]
MATRDPRHDIYISNAQSFAKPVLGHIRKLVHRACPDVEETMKWSFPHFDYHGKILCSMASFKQHAVLNFWLSSRIGALRPYLITEGAAKAMGQLGRLTSVKDLPPDRVLLQALKEAMVLIDAGASLKKAPPQKAAELLVPDALKKALSNNKTAKAVFENFPPSHRKEYIQWITEAKTDTTRNKRIATALEWLAEGKNRNWKYERKNQKHRPKS